MSECGAKIKNGANAGKSCKQPAMRNGRCYHHGGKSPGGPLTAGGRHSKYLPARLAARYEEAQKDAELLSVSAEVALIDTRLGELFGRLDTTETSAAWKLANRLYHKMRTGDPKERFAAEAELGNVLQQGLLDCLAWSEIGSLIEQRRKCAETEAKRLAQREQFVTAKEANVLMAAIVRLVTENVPDPDARRRIAAGLAGLADARDHRGADARGVN